jgi:hypothetical protein
LVSTACWVVLQEIKTVNDRTVTREQIVLIPKLFFMPKIN